MLGSVNTAGQAVSWTVSTSNAWPMPLRCCSFFVRRGEDLILAGHVTRKRFLYQIDRNTSALPLDWNIERIPLNATVHPINTSLVSILRYISCVYLTVHLLCLSYDTSLVSILRYISCVYLTVQPPRVVEFLLNKTRGIPPTPRSAQKYLLYRVAQGKVPRS